MPPLLKHRSGGGDVDPGIRSSKTVSMVSRVQERGEEVRRNFNLPEKESLMDEFYCALHKKILFQGRMYVFENYVCFYSNLFGWVKRKAIPIRDITDVAKKRNYGFPNSIQIGWKGKKEFFTSFLSRDDAFMLIQSQWNQTRLSMNSEKSELDSVGPSRRHSESGMAKDQDPDMEDEPPSDSPDEGDRVKHRSSTSRLSFQRDNHVSQKHGLERDSDSDVDDGGDDDTWVVQAGPVPAVPENMDLIMEADFPVPVQEFFQKTLASESIFLEKYHTSRGDQRLRLSQWQKHSALEGMVRHSTFVSPVKAPGGFRVGLISPKETECNQNQRYRVYEEENLVFETSQVMKDIPYGDNFTVEMRWDISPACNRVTRTEGCHVTIYGGVPFIRHVISPIRMMIESSVMKELRSSVAQLFEIMRETMVSSSSKSVSETSVEAPIRAEYDLDEMLSRRELRAKILDLLRESLDHAERSHLLGKTTSTDLGAPAPGPAPQESRALSQMEVEGGDHWANNLMTMFPQSSWNAMIGAGLLLIFLFQLVNLFFWMRIPRGYLTSTPTDVVNWQESVRYMNQDLHSLQDRLDVLSKGVLKAIEHLKEVRQQESVE